MKNIKKIFLFSLLSIIFGGSVVLLGNVAVATVDEKVDICHKNGNSDNWNALSVSVNGWNEDNNSGHSDHENDYLVPVDKLVVFNLLNKKDKDKWCKDNAPKIVDQETESNPGSIKVCKTILDVGGNTVAGDSGSTFTISFDGNASYEGTASSTVPSDVTFNTSLAYNDQTIKDAECKTINNLPLGRYYYEEEEISDSSNWDAPKYNDKASGSSGLSDAGVFNTNSDAQYDRFDGVINLSENTPNRVLLVVNQMKEKPTVTIHATKLVCDSESDLPDWGTAESVPQSITSNTATQYETDSNGKCKIVPWDFEWSYRDLAGDPDDNTPGFFGGNWTAFNNGKAIIDVSEDTKLGIKEVYNSDYIPFTGENINKNVPSAEMYCGNDVYHYDNWEWLDVTAGEEYHCVAWNVLKEKPAEPKQCDIVSDESNIVIEGGTNAVEAWNHANWYDETPLGGLAKWIWETFNVVNPTVDTTKTFVKTFNLDSTPTSAMIDVAADNGFILEVNGNVVANEITNEFNYNAVKSYNVLSKLNPSGLNTIKVTVKNFALANSTPQSNPAGVVYKLHIEDSSCSSVPTEPKKSTVEICKVDENQNPLSGWQLMLLGDKFGSTKVLPNGNDYTISSVPAGDYVVKASGKYKYRSTAGAEYSDAAYSERAPSDAVYINTTQLSYLPWVKVNDFPTAVKGFLGVKLNGTITDWGSMFNPSHIYALGTTTTTTGDMKFSITDDHYSDNSGSIDVDVYEGYQGITTTGQDGCVIFTDVPYGTYTIDEIIQDEWENVSGLGEVVVDSPRTRFVVVNEKEDSVNTITPGISFKGFRDQTNTTYDNTPAIKSCGSVNNSGFMAWEWDLNTPGVGAMTYDYTIISGPAAGFKAGSLSNTHYNGLIPSFGTYVVEVVGKDSLGTPSNTISCSVTYQPLNEDPKTQCNDDIDNDGDNWIDEADPGCHTDGDAENSSSYDPMDDDEKDETVEVECPGDKILEDGVCVEINDPEEVCEEGQEGTYPDCKDPEEPKTPTRRTGSSGSRISYVAPALAGQVLGAEASCGIYVDKFLKKGLKGNDKEAVSKVQLFLNNYMGIKLKVDGIFGSRTDAALKTFQMKHKDKILDPWGLKAPTGIFYLTTQTEVNNIMCPELNLQIPALVPMAQNPLFPKA